MILLLHELGRFFSVGMKMAHFAKLQVLLLLVLACSCSARNTEVPVTRPEQTLVTTLPSPSALPRSASASNSIDGADFAVQTNGTVVGSQLDITVPASGPGSGLGFAIYVFDSLSYLPVVLSVATNDNFDARVWIAFAN